jgi:hypothetical protein
VDFSNSGTEHGSNVETFGCTTQEDKKSDHTERAKFSDGKGWGHGQSPFTHPLNLVQTYERDLNDAFRTLSSLEQSDVKQAWDLYYTVFKRITNQLQQVSGFSIELVHRTPCAPIQLQQLDLKFVSPKLLTCEDLELAVPGAYAPNQPLVRIKSIRPNITVISSKQRPRKICIQGGTV